MVCPVSGTLVVTHQVTVKVLKFLTSCFTHHCQSEVHCKVNNWTNLAIALILFLLYAAEMLRNPQRNVLDLYFLLFLWWCLHLENYFFLTFFYYSFSCTCFIKDWCYLRCLRKKPVKLDWIVTNWLVMVCVMVVRLPWWDFVIKTGSVLVPPAVAHVTGPHENNLYPCLHYIL